MDEVLSVADAVFCFRDVAITAGLTVAWVLWYANHSMCCVVRTPYSVLTTSSVRMRETCVYTNLSASVYVCTQQTSNVAVGWVGVS